MKGTNKGRKIASNQWHDEERDGARKERAAKEVEAKEGGGEDGGGGGARVFLSQFSDRDHRDVFFRGNDGGCWFT